MYSTYDKGGNKTTLVITCFGEFWTATRDRLLPLILLVHTRFLNSLSKSNLFLEVLDNIHRITSKTF